MTYRMEGYRNRIPVIVFPCKIDLGAGQYPQPGFTRIDFDPHGTDIVWDITNGIPLPDDSVCELFTSHFLEHLVPTDAHYVLKEIFRVCAHGAKVTIKLPHMDTPEGRLPCHYSFWNEDTMRAIDQWLPHTGHPHSNGDFFDVQNISRIEYHVIGEFRVVKGAPL